MKNPISWFIAREKARQERNLVEHINSMFQIKERDGELWLTHEGHSVCPCAMLKDTPVEAVRKMRELYRQHLWNK